MRSISPIRPSMDPTAVCTRSIWAAVITAAKITAPILAHYAGNDPGVNAGIPAYEAALKANNKKYEIFVYAGTQHGFHNDTTPRYDEAAAKLAWSRSLEFFNKNLR